MGAKTEESPKRVVYTHAPGAGRPFDCMVPGLCSRRSKFISPADDLGVLSYLLEVIRHRRQRARRGAAVFEVDVDGWV